MTQRRLVALVTLGLVLAACTSVPVSTMWKMARFDRAALLAVDPAQLRAAALVDARATMDNVTMKISLAPKDGRPVDYQIPLTAPVTGDPRLSPAPPGRRWNVFALAAEGQRDFMRMRESALALPPGSSLTIGLSAREGTVPPDLARRFPLRLDLLLDPQDGWFTVLKDSELDLTKYAGKG